MHQCVYLFDFLVPLELLHPAFWDWSGTRKRV